LVNLALIGTGAWGRNLLRNFAHLKGAHLKVCCDVDGDQCKTTLNGYRGIRP